MKPVEEHSVDIGVRYDGIPDKRKERTAAIVKNNKDRALEKKTRLLECKRLKTNRFTCVNTQVQCILRTFVENELFVTSVEVPYREVREEWRKECGPTHEKTIAEHYGIFRYKSIRVHSHWAIAKFFLIFVFTGCE